MSIIIYRLAKRVKEEAMLEEVGVGNHNYLQGGSTKN